MITSLARNRTFLYRRHLVDCRRSSHPDPAACRVGASALALMYFIFAGFWLPRFSTAVHLLGFKTALVSLAVCGVGYS